MFLNTLTPKFYVALTGTSSLISGLILTSAIMTLKSADSQIFEWWYFRKYGTSFIEQVSVSHLRPLLGGVDSSTPSTSNTSNGEADSNRQSVSESRAEQPDCKMSKLFFSCRANPSGLLQALRTALIYTWVTGREPLTYYDMNLSAQDHQTFFTCDSDHLRPADAAFILLAEEEATTIMEAERLFKQALKAGEGCYRRSQQLQHHGTQYEAQHRRDTNVLVYIKRRLAMCSRKLGRTREAVKMMRDLMKEFPLLSMFNIHENLLESLLELQNYADVQAVLAKYDDISLPKSATICYTAALLKARAVSDKGSVTARAEHSGDERSRSHPQSGGVQPSRPQKHILKRGDSEAIAYAFFHLQHWKRVEGALNLLHCTWEGMFHEVSVYPKKELPFFILFTAGLCSFTAMLALLTHQFPELMGVFAKAFLSTLFAPLNFIMEKVESILPSSLWHQLTRI
ncbi:Suppressor of tumorigenicity 7 protein like [Dissostichus eleginoides]|uniref:Suppressor of tumorigenicity 7 protein like n=1 Tax=Dissostichus eleginoides TaxID=100907 RepID=A0AAD9F4C8_DISEL|nr:Suppressor of tumorigenicity 7 protein like [Dissostichus eleginoides]